MNLRKQQEEVVGEAEEEEEQGNIENRKWKLQQLHFHFELLNNLLLRTVVSLQSL